MWFRNIFGAKRSTTQPKAQPGGQDNAALLSAQTLRQLDRMYLNTGPLIHRQQSGTRTSAMRRPSADFRDFRQYAPGDDVRFVDWKASARQEHIFIKQGEQQKAAMIYVLLDCSASMAWGAPPKAQSALALAHALSYLALGHGDRLVVVPVQEPGGQSSLRPLGPLWGKGQSPLLSKYFQAIRFKGQVDLARTLAGLSQQKQTRGGLVLVISDLLGASDLAKGLDALPAPIWNVVLCHLLHPEEINPQLNGYYELQDVETGQKKRYPVTTRVLDTYRQRLYAWQSEIARVCEERKARYTLLPTNLSLAHDVLPKLRQIQVVKSQ